MPILTTDSLVPRNCDQTGYTECHIAYWIWRFFPLILIAVGVIGNILNVTILSRKQLRKKSTCVYLLFLAVTDMMLLCFGTSVQTLRNVFQIDVYTWSAFSCIVTDWVSHSAATASCWLIVLVTSERALVTLFPTKAKPKMTPKNALLVSVCLLVFVTLFNGHLLYAFIFSIKNVNVTGTNETRVNILKSCILRQGVYTEFYNTTWGTLLFVFGSLLPICLVLTGNAIVGISFIKRKRALRRIQIADGSTAGNTSQLARKGFSINMLFILSGVFVITTVPYCVHFILLEFNKEVDEHTLAKHQLLNVLFRCLVVCNFSFNFLLYFMTGSLFKREFKLMIESIYKNVQPVTGRSAVHPMTDRAIH